MKLSTSELHTWHDMLFTNQKCARWGGSLFERHTHDLQPLDQSSLPFENQNDIFLNTTTRSHLAQLLPAVPKHDCPLSPVPRWPALTILQPSYLLYIGDHVVWVRPWTLHITIRWAGHMPLCITLMCLTEDLTVHWARMPECWGRLSTLMLKLYLVGLDKTWGVTL